MKKLLLSLFMLVVVANCVASDNEETRLLKSKKIELSYLSDQISHFLQNIENNKKLSLVVWSRRIVVYTTKKQKAGGKAYGTSITQARPNNGGSASRDTK